MKLVARLLNEMRAAGVIVDYALFGAVAQMRDTEPVATLDAEVLVAVRTPERLDVLAPIYQCCAGKGYNPEGGGSGRCLAGSVCPLLQRTDPRGLSSGGYR